MGERGADLHTGVGVEEARVRAVYGHPKASLWIDDDRHGVRGAGRTFRPRHLANDLEVYASRSSIKPSTLVMKMRLQSGP